MLDGTQHSLPPSAELYALLEMSDYQTLFYYELVCMQVVPQ